MRTYLSALWSSRKNELTSADAANLVCRESSMKNTFELGKISVAIFGGLVLSYVAFYLAPIFLNSAEVMQFPTFVPSFPPIGIDFRWLWTIENEWKEGLLHGQMLKTGAAHFPPLTLPMFGWASLFPFPVVYRILTFMTLSAYLSVATVLPYLVSRKVPELSGLWLLALPFGFFGLNAYGLQFEIERGQWNVIAVALALWAIYVYQLCSPKLKPLAYALMLMGCQMKLYPMIFIFGFYSHKKSLRENFKTVSAMILANVALIFVFGFEVAQSFLKSVSALNRRSEYGFAQISIHSFFSLVREKQNSLYPVYMTVWVLAIAGALVSWFNVIRKHSVANNIVALFLLLVVGLVLPSHSNDYKLALVPLAVPIVVMSLPILVQGKRNRGVAIFLLLFFLTSTFYSYATKGGSILVQNNFMNLIFSGLILMMLMNFGFSSKNESNAVAR